MFRTVDNQLSTYCCFPTLLEDTILLSNVPFDCSVYDVPDDILEGGHQFRLSKAILNIQNVPLVGFFFPQCCGVYTKRPGPH